MAHTNAPTHDFAPPWLKIPSYDSVKPSGADGERGGYASHKEGNYHGSARHAKESDSYAPRHPSSSELRRERNAFSGERKQSYLSSYHHSLDFEDSFFESNGFNTPAPTNNCNGTSSSHTAAVRRPHSRHDFRNGPSYAKGELFNNHSKMNSGGYYNSRSKAKILESCTNSNSIYDENGGINVTSNNFNQEFPSLQGDVSEEPISTPVNGGVWEKPRNIKVHGSGGGKKLQLVKKPSSIDSSSESSRRSLLASSSSLTGSVLSSSGGSMSTNSHTVIVTPVAKTGSGIYRALVPAKGTKKQLCKDGTKTSAPKKPPSSAPAPSTHSMEILVKHPKACGNKSEFLKALRNENQSLKEAEEKNEKSSSDLDGKDVDAKEHQQVEKPHTNGIDIEKLTINEDNEKPLLSSSLEAEQRLLREMGWKEEVSDDDNYAPLTEDEMKEFKALSEQIAKKNGMRRSLQTNFSPRHIAPFTANVSLPADTCTSSSESDSDF